MRFGGGRSTVVVYGIFAASGVGLTLPGAMLPVLLPRWAMTDAQAGLLLFLFFAGTMGGTVLARGALDRAIALACGGCAAGLGGLAFAAHGGALAAMAVYGGGLGMAMTAISVLRSRLHPETRVTEMARLNFVWAMGACAGPWIGLHESARFGVVAVLLAVAGCFAVAGLLAWMMVETVEAPAVVSAGWWGQMRMLPAELMVFVALATGVEAAMGGWLATFARRSGESVSGAVGAVTWLWVGVLVARLVQSQRGVGKRTEAWVPIVGPAAIVAAIVLLMMAPGGWLPLAAGLLLGLGIGPMYPLAVALVLRRGEAGNAAFLAGGTGSSLLPLLTGWVAEMSGSLRTGLSVPLVGGVALLAIGVWVRRGARDGRAVEPY